MEAGAFEWGRDRERERGRERENILIICAVSAEPQVGLLPPNCEIMT